MWTGGTRFPPGVKNGFFSLRHGGQNGSGAYPASYSMGIRGSFPRREADHSPLSTAQLKNEWIYTSTHPYVFMACCLIKHRHLKTLLQHFVKGQRKTAEQLKKAFSWARFAPETSQEVPTTRSRRLL